MASPRINVRLTDDLNTRLRSKALAEGTTPSRIVQRLLREGLVDDGFRRDTLAQKNLARCPHAGARTTVSGFRYCPDCRSRL